MKQLLVVISVLCCSLSSMAIQKDAVHLNAGAGWMSKSAIATYWREANTDKPQACQKTIKNF